MEAKGPRYRQFFSYGGLRGCNEVCGPPTRAGARIAIAMSAMTVILAPRLVSTDLVGPRPFPHGVGRGRATYTERLHRIAAYVG